MTLTQHTHINRFPSSNFNFGIFYFLFFLSMQPLASAQYARECMDGRTGEPFEPTADQSEIDEPL